MKFVWQKEVFVLMALAILTSLSSCSNLEIVKRKYRKGYHIHKLGEPEKSASTQAPAPSAKSGQLCEISVKEISSQTTQNHPLDNHLGFAEATSVRSGYFSEPDEPSKSQMQISKEVFQQSLFQRNKQVITGEFYRAVGIEPEEDKPSWNPYGFVGLGFGTLAFILVIMGGVNWLRYNPPNGTEFYFIGAGAALTLAVVLGIIGLKKKSIKHKKGRGFSYASWGSGILAGVSFVLIALMYVIWQIGRAF